MPDYPPIDGLQQLVERKILPRKAGDLSPVAMRAAESLRQLYPADMYSTSIRELPVTDRHAFSNVLGETPLDTSMLFSNKVKEDPQEIQLNPALGMGFNQHDVTHTMAHELEHVRQGRNRDPLERLHEAFTLPYEQQPDEQAAFKAADRAPLGQQPKTGPNTADSNAIIAGLGKLFLRQ